MKALDDFLQKVEPKKRKSKLIRFRNEILKLFENDYTVQQIQFFLKKQKVETSIQNIYKFLKKQKKQQEVKKNFPLQKSGESNEPIKIDKEMNFSEFRQKFQQKINKE